MDRETIAEEKLRVRADVLMIRMLKPANAKNDDLRFPVNACTLYSVSSNDPLGPAQAAGFLKLHNWRP